VTSGSVSDSYEGPNDNCPYVPSWCYNGGAKICICGCHEGYHNDDGECLKAKNCKCETFTDSGKIQE